MSKITEKNGRFKHDPTDDATQEDESDEEPAETHQ